MIVEVFLPSAHQHIPIVVYDRPWPKRRKRYVLRCCASECPWKEPVGYDKMEAHERANDIFLIAVPRARFELATSGV